jgi:hypothetical protein
MENPSTWTRATNVIDKALTDYATDQAAGRIGLSQAAYVEQRLKVSRYLTDEANVVVGIQE